MTAIRIKKAQSPCVENPDLFFPESHRIEDHMEAKRLCQSCPRMDECREFAVSNKIRYGVWGGLTPHERGVWIIEEKDDGTVVGGAPNGREQLSQYIDVSTIYTPYEVARKMKINLLTLQQRVRVGMVPEPDLYLSKRFYWLKESIDA